MIKMRTSFIVLCLTLTLFLGLSMVATKSYQVYSAEPTKGITVEAIEKQGIRIWSESGCGTVYNLGDLLNLRIKSSRSGYLTVFDLMPNGEVQVLFPNKFDRNNYIRSGRVYEIPGITDPFQLRISPPKGRDQILAVVTENREKLVREDFSFYAEKFPKLSDSKGEVLQQVKKGVEVIPDRDWWAADSCEIYVGNSSKPYEPEDEEDAPTEETQGPLKGRALIVGIESYSGEEFEHMGHNYKFSDLQYSLDDARAVEETLTGKVEEIKLLTNEDATYGKVKKTVKDWLGAVDADELALLYFSGHGAYQMDMSGDEDDGNDEVLVPYDYARAEKFIVDDEINDWLNNLPAERIVYIADSCYAGTSSKAVRSFTMSNTKSANQEVLDDSIGKDLMGPSSMSTKGTGKQLVALEASKPNQSAIEDEELKHGVFTYYLIKGLKGDADQNGDGKISTQELFEFSQEKVLEYTKSKQEPMCSGCSRENLFLAFVR
ncbi:DUF4384 domain-containing protein [Candidatus Bipolaricaulota bacterium]|nr:DUF4384 domain-containing protein [Candidatus Bipolaricaulota bacterium]MBS3792455.1 DUF4384 domain-containing protein [Candidatus Bipolaricaulota bacterium]